MKYLKRFENLKEDNSEILSDLTDDDFDIEIIDKEKRKNQSGDWDNIRIRFIKINGRYCTEFELSEIKDYVKRIIVYMRNNDFKLKYIYAFKQQNMSKDFNLTIDIDQWDLNMKVFGINFYFD